jgi:hypothetical protein
MAYEREIVDISNSPDLLRLAEDVRRSNTPRVLRRDDIDVAVVLPLADGKKRKGKRTRTEEDHQAFYEAGGSWKDEDTDTLVQNIYESRRHSSRPPVEL